MWILVWIGVGVSPFFLSWSLRRCHGMGKWWFVGFGVDQHWRVWVFSFVVFVVVPWCGLGMIRFQSAVVGFLWGVVSGGRSRSHREEQIFFFLLRPMNLGVFLKGCFDWLGFGFRLEFWVKRLIFCHSSWFFIACSMVWV